MVCQDILESVCEAFMFTVELLSQVIDTDLVKLLLWVTPQQHENVSSEPSLYLDQTWDSMGHFDRVHSVFDFIIKYLNISLIIILVFNICLQFFEKSYLEVILNSEDFNPKSENWLGYFDVLIVLNSIRDTLLLHLCTVLYKFINSYLPLWKEMEKI